MKLIRSANVWTPGGGGGGGDFLLKSSITTTALLTTFCVAAIGCRKGGRGCAYPNVVPSTKAAAAKVPRNGNASGSREGSSSLEDVEEEEDGSRDGTSPVDSEPRPRSATSLSQQKAPPPQQPRGASSHSSSDQSRPGKSRKTASSVDQTPSPRDLGSSALTSPTGSLRRTASAYSLVGSSDWDHLPHDVAFYLNYHQQVLTCHHYLLKSDCDGFFKKTLLEHAVKNEALLYAVASFACFHYSVFYTTGASQMFLEYYNKAVALLRVSLDKEHSIDTVLTILQLACFEVVVVGSFPSPASPSDPCTQEYLGDWASLMDHRNAASQIIKTQWTPTTITETCKLRMVFNWFVHFDLICAMMAGHKATITPEWSEICREAVFKRLKENPGNILLKIENAAGDFREITVKVSTMTAKRAQGEMSAEDFKRDFPETLQSCHDWWASLDPDILEGAELIALPTSDIADPDDASPFTPAPLYTGNRWAVNFLILDYYGLLIVLKQQVALTIGIESQPDLDDSLAEYAIKICELLTAIEAYPHTPAGALLSAQAPIGLAALRLPDLPNYRQWMQRQLAKAEKMGYFFLLLLAALRFLTLLKVLSIHWPTAPRFPPCGGIPG